MRVLPIHDLLNRIRWDEEFGKAAFEIGYLDHVEQEIVRISFKKIHLDAEGRFSFQLVTEPGEVLTIPFHRIREVYRDGELIWKRPGP